METELYRLKEFCQKYAISRTSAYREINAGRLALLKRGGLCFITHMEAERWFWSLAHYKTEANMSLRNTAILMRNNKSTEPPPQDKSLKAKKKYRRTS